jgi:hypothetical protein
VNVLAEVGVVGAPALKPKPGAAAGAAGLPKPGDAFAPFPLLAPPKLKLKPPDAAGAGADWAADPKGFAAGDAAGVVLPDPNPNEVEAGAAGCWLPKGFAGAGAAGVEVLEPKPNDVEGAAGAVLPF